MGQTRLFVLYHTLLGFAERTVLFAYKIERHKNLSSVIHRKLSSVWDLWRGEPFNFQQCSVCENCCRPLYVFGFRKTSLSVVRLSEMTWKFTFHFHFDSSTILISTLVKQWFISYGVHFSILSFSKYWKEMRNENALHASFTKIAYPIPSGSRKKLITLLSPRTHQSPDH